MVLLLAVPAPAAAENALSPDEGAARAQALFGEGRPDQALEVLRPIAASHAGNTNIRFLLGLAAMEASRMSGVAEADRTALLDEAIATLHAILVDRPELVRVRLELARAFFYKGEDSLARSHFERVLAGEVPEAVKANVQRFLVQIRARRRWTMYMGAALLPDTNIGSGTDEDVIYINFAGIELPFDFNPAQETTTSGIGASLWAGGEYQHPLGPRLRLRAGGDLARREYAGSRYDSTFLSLHAGPRWLVDRRTEASVLAKSRGRHRPWHNLRYPNHRNWNNVRPHRRDSGRKHGPSRPSNRGRRPPSFGLPYRNRRNCGNALLPRRGSEWRRSLSGP